jgi:hypothetical protein
MEMNKRRVSVKVEKREKKKGVKEVIYEDNGSVSRCGWSFEKYVEVL